MQPSAFGTVFLGLNLNSGELMAVKQLDTNIVTKKDLVCVLSFCMYVHVEVDGCMPLSLAHVFRCCWSTRSR